MNASHPGPAAVSIHNATPRRPWVGSVDGIPFLKKSLPLLYYKRHIVVPLLALLLLAACGKKSLTASSDIPSVQGSVVLTPSGALAVHAHTFGRVLPWHVETAESSWRHVAPCVGVELGAVRAFPVLLLASGSTCSGADTPGCLHTEGPARIEILGASWDFDPARPEASPAPTAEIARLWRHEMHLALWRRDRDPDSGHTRAEWSCQLEASR